MIFLNPCLALHKRSGRFMTSTVQSGIFVEDITTMEPPLSPVDIIVVFNDSHTTGSDEPQPTYRQLRVRRAGRTRIGNWADDQFSSTIAAYDSGMSMKKASLQFGIPYSSFREHCYGIRKLRVKETRGVISMEEEQQLSDWFLSMVERGYGLTPTALKMKVNEITMSKVTPFREGIPGRGWMRGWKRRYPKLILQTTQALETTRTKGLCKDNVASFYDNLETLYSRHKYPSNRIWNCDEFGTQAGKNGSGIVIAKTGAHHVHSIVPDQREWLSVLVCVNVARSAIPSFYIFRRKRFGKNYIV